VSDCTVWVDGDSCQANIRSIIERAANRRKFRTVFVADRELPLEETAYVSTILVETGDDAADDRITQLVGSGDLVITRDVTLTARVVEKGATVLDDRGGVFTAENTAERKSIHNFLSSLREAGVYPKEPKRGSSAGSKAFADAFDRMLTTYVLRSDR